MEDWEQAIGYLIGFVVIILGITIAIQDCSNSEFYGKVKDKVSGVEVIDEHTRQQEYNANHVSKSDEDAVVTKIRSTYQGFKRNDVEIRSIEDVKLINNNREFIVQAISTNGRTVYIKGNVNKKKGRFIIKHNSIVLQ